ncbi:MAG: GatB/YqeY domain-containing protein [Candidatus Neomarinimicrobiota bacterium]|jgi:hypothetical protein|nr:GatB/YqeY domain-containing protein [Candidatus Neomarinimicrobiota bacterium]MDD3966194.1 GatB/YqeY domain-containing protein [Candidatus Neomarinimicrobiota bacterium]
MTYLEQIQNDLKRAMLNRENDKMRTLRLLLSKLREKKIELIRDLQESDELGVLKKAAKERQDSMQTYAAAGRNDLAEVEKQELLIIQSYLPAELDDAALETIVRQAIVQTGAATPGDLGKVMSASMKALAGRADGRRVQEIVKKLLGV